MANFNNIVRVIVITCLTFRTRNTYEAIINKQRTYSTFFGSIVYEGVILTLLALEISLVKFISIHIITFRTCTNTRTHQTVIHRTTNTSISTNIKEILSTFITFNTCIQIRTVKTLCKRTLLTFLSRIINKVIL